MCGDDPELARGDGDAECDEQHPAHEVDGARVPAQCARDDLHAIERDRAEQEGDAEPDAIGDQEHGAVGWTRVAGGEGEDGRERWPDARAPGDGEGGSHGNGGKRGARRAPGGGALLRSAHETGWDDRFVKCHRETDEGNHETADELEVPAVRQGARNGCGGGAEEREQDDETGDEADRTGKCGVLIIGSARDERDVTGEQGSDAGGEERDHSSGRRDPECCCGWEVGYIHGSLNMIRSRPLWRRAPAFMTPKYWIPAMKSDIHPDYQPIVFRDTAGDHAILTKSTMTSDKTIVWEDGETYPVIDVEVSSASHSFYTGKQRLMDTGGRLGRFQAKLEAVGDAPADTGKKKKNVSRTFVPAVDPKILAAKAARAEAKALEDAKKKAADEEAEKVAAVAAAAEKAAAEKAAKAEAEAAAAAPAEEAPEEAAAEPAAEAATEEAPAAEETPAEEAAPEEA